MGFFDRFRAPPERTEPIIFPATEETGTYKASDGTKLWRNGYALVDEYGSFLRWEAPEITEADSMICRVAGVSHRARELQQEEFAPGSLLLLRPEPNNAHDRNAVGVWDEAGQIQVGYLPREKAQGVAASFRRRQPKGAMVLQELRRSEGAERVSLVILVCPLGPVRLELGDDQPHRGDVEEAPEKGRHQRTGPGAVRGRHHTEWVDAVKELRRQGDEEAAEELLVALVDATEAEARAEGLTMAISEAATVIAA
jgi:hypothetical protein